MISIISERYNIHPQTLRLYEREGLIKPSRTGGNTRLYGPDEIRKLELILTLTRDLGVNLAGVEVILNMQRELEKQRELQRQKEAERQREAEEHRHRGEERRPPARADLNIEDMLDYIRQVMFDRRVGINREGALVKIGPTQVQHVKRSDDAEPEEMISERVRRK